MRALQLALAVAAASAPASLSFAQDLNPLRPEAVGAPMRDLEAVATRVGAGTLDSKISLPNAIEIAADQDEKTATINLSTKDWFSAPGVSQYATLKIKVPFDKDNTNPAKLDGFVNAASAEFKYTFTGLTGWQAPPSNKLDDVCREVARRFDDASAEVKAKKSPEFACADPQKNIRRNITTEDADLVGMGYEMRKLYFKPTAGVWLAGVTGTIATKEFKYRNPATLAELTERDTPWALGGYFGFAHIHTNTLVTFAYEHEHAKKDMMDRTACPTAVTPPATSTDCITAAFGPPVSDDKDNLSVELRHKGRDFGLAAKATYDVKDDVFGVEVPVYFIPGADGGLSGGIRFSWNDRDDDVVAGVFFNQKLCLFCNVR